MIRSYVDSLVLPPPHTHKKRTVLERIKKESKKSVKLEAH